MLEFASFELGMRTTYEMFVKSFFFRNGVLASGDSRGFVTLWNPENGALIQVLFIRHGFLLGLIYSKPYCGCFV